MGDSRGHPERWEPRPAKIECRDRRDEGEHDKKPHDWKGGWVRCTSTVQSLRCKVRLCLRGRGSLALRCGARRPPGDRLAPARPLPSGFGPEGGGAAGDSAAIKGTGCSPCGVWGPFRARLDGGVCTLGAMRPAGNCNLTTAGTFSAGISQAPLPDGKKPCPNNFSNLTNKPICKLSVVLTSRAARDSLL